MFLKNRWSKYRRFGFFMHKMRLIKVKVKIFFMLRKRHTFNIYLMIYVSKPIISYIIYRFAIMKTYNRVWICVLSIWNSLERLFIWVLKSWSFDYFG